jgi:formylglycine-generating enzyme required for sulfatase activity
MQNELDMEVPPDIAKKANQLKCHQNVKYVYKDGKYGNKLPAASIGGKKATRFGSIGRANEYKVHLGNGWVAFKSPSYSNFKVTEDLSKIEELSLSDSNINKTVNNNSTNIKNNNISSPINITREHEFYQGYIRFKISVSNESPYVIHDVTLDFIFEDRMLYIAKHDDYPVKNRKFILGNIYGNKSKTFTLLFEPLTCSKAADIKCQVNYADHEGKMASVWMEPKEISVVCPIMKTDQDINIGRLKEFIEKLPSRDSRVYEIQGGFDIKKLATLSREVVEKHDVRYISTLHTRDDKTCEIWYYGKTKVNMDDIVIKVAIFTEHQTMELFAATASAEILTGLLAEVGRNLKQALESNVGGKRRVVSVHITDSVMQRSNLLDMCDIDGSCDVNIVIKDSVVQRSNIASVDEEKHNVLTQEAARQKTVEEAERKRKVEEEHRRREAEELKRKKEDKQALKSTSSSIPNHSASTNESIDSNRKKKESKIKAIFPLLLLIFIGGYLMGSPLLTEMFDSSDEVAVSESMNENVTDVSQNYAVIPIVTELPDYGEELDYSSDSTQVETDTVTNEVEEPSQTFTNSIGMEFVLIPAGEFMMGSDDWSSKELPMHEVTIDDAFYLGKYEVTQKQWIEIMSDNPSYFIGDNNPVETVSWNDVQEFVAKLNEMEGTNKYRLPSEAEWEYACRAGTTTYYSFGDDESELGEYAWYDVNSGGIPHPVGQKKPNPWGLYDMHGNINEWVQDKMHNTYENAPIDGSAWEEGSSPFVVSRGGAFFSAAEYCRSSYRGGASQTSSYNGHGGFRLLMDI